MKSVYTRNWQNLESMWDVKIRHEYVSICMTVKRWGNLECKLPNKPREGKTCLLLIQLVLIQAISAWHIERYIYFIVCLVDVAFCDLYICTKAQKIWYVTKYPWIWNYISKTMQALLHHPFYIDKFSYRALLLILVQLKNSNKRPIVV